MFPRVSSLPQLCALCVRTDLSSLKESWYGVGKGCTREDDSASIVASWAWSWYGLVSELIMSRCSWLALVAYLGTKREMAMGRCIYVTVAGARVDRTSSCDGLGSKTG